MIKKKTLLTTLVLLSVMQGSVQAASVPYNDFFKVGRSNSSFVQQGKNGEIIKSTLAGETDTVQNDGNNVVIDVHSIIQRDSNSDKGMLFFIGGSYYYQGKNITVNFHEDATFDGGDNDSGVGQPSFKLGGFNNSDKVVINVDNDKTLSIIGSTTKTNNYQTFHIECESQAIINGGNLLVKHIYPNPSSEYADAVRVEDNSNLEVNNQSVKILREFNRDENIWSGWTDSGILLNYSEATFNTGSFFIGSSNAEKYESFESGAKVSNSNLTIRSNDIHISGSDYALIALKESNVNLNQETNGSITLINNSSDTSKNSESSAVYVEGNKSSIPEVNLTSNQINILSNNKSVWASGDGGTVNINGAVNINAQYTGTDGTSLLAEDGGQHIAIVAGVAGADSLDTNHGEVNVTLKGTEDSCITGDIVAARDGIVNITHEDYTGKLQIIGDILAGNGRTDSNSLQLGVANVDIGEGGYWEGRADDYQDADLKADSSYFDPHFTDSKVDTAGEVNITMGEGSVWNVTGQSWVTNLTGDKSTIILCGKDTSGNIKGTGGYSIHIGALEGENTFVVNLNPEDVAGSDMIYIQDGTNAKQTLLVNNESELLNLQEGERIRFATIADAEGSFEYGGAYSGTGTFGETYTVKGRGLKNVELGVQYVDMDQEDEVEDTYHDVGTDDQYNGGDKFTESDIKPGSSYVEGTYDKVDENKNSQNVYLVRGEGSSSNPGDDDDLTDSGETIVNMSHANYKNAVYMDRLNKRLGEARYIDGDEGMWVRLRHDRIGMKDEFRSMNTMYQLGYDKLDNKDDKGERHIGAAIDYMDGSTSYSDIYGEGETRRWGFWMYDTWLGNKGHYADYIVKFGHLHNEFDLKDKDSGEKVTGDYDNNVFSISAEYGRKKDIGNNWYFEPQAQLQLARVTDAEYKTSQDTDVYVDGINSLIGRAGFRLGKDVDERSTVYVKADVLHEFLGDQRIVAGDVTGSLDKTYENKGTWYDIGFGFATAVGHDSYAYLDFEKSFGNDNDDTYQINAGLQWNF